VTLRLAPVWPLVARTGVGVPSGTRTAVLTPPGHTGANGDIVPGGANPVTPVCHAGTMDDIQELVNRMARIAYARNRDTDREPRYVTITDDEAVDLIESLGLNYRLH
jgi:hypothetical protein